jgi:hypothetical protein
MNNIFYGHAPVVNGLFLRNLERNETHIHNIEAKRCKVDSDNLTYLWHCRLGHIGVKRMTKLYSDGLLESLDFESFDAINRNVKTKNHGNLFVIFLCIPPDYSV